jgi:hypothetical protein
MKFRPLHDRVVVKRFQRSARPCRPFRLTIAGEIDRCRILYCFASFQLADSMSGDLGKHSKSVPI